MKLIWNSILKKKPEPRSGELTYYRQIGSDACARALQKPFVDADRASCLMRVGAVLSRLPQPPARILECGCGTGWLCYFLAKCGYDVVGVDVSTDAISLARAHPMFAEGPIPDFVVANTERLKYSSEFDVVIFFDSLHHSVDEEAAIASAFRALKRGGILVTDEPGDGHAEASKETVEKFDVTEKDMPPRHIIEIGEKIGFSKWKAFLHNDFIDRINTPARHLNWTGTVVMEK